MDTPHISRSAGGGCRWHYRRRTVMKRRRQRSDSTASSQSQVAASRNAYDCDCTAQLRNSIGIGKMMVEFFSAEMVFSV